MEIIIFFILLALAAVQAVRYDCCLEKFTTKGFGCESPTVYENETYYCVEVAESCSSCELSTNLSSSSCYQCCVTDDDVCISFSYISSSSWSKLSESSMFDKYLTLFFFVAFPALICIIFAGSCCCCSIVFLSAEHSRIKEGITFREAYLLPIPLVAAELDFEDKDYLFPPDQPTAIAREHQSIDVPVAEPTENSALVGMYFPDREFSWDN